MNDRPKIELNEEAIRGQLEELKNSGLSDDLKGKIAALFMSILVAHPDWKVYKVLRKAGEFYNVKFEFD